MNNILGQILVHLGSMCGYDTVHWFCMQALCTGTGTGRGTDPSCTTEIYLVPVLIYLVPVLSTRPRDRETTRLDRGYSTVSQCLANCVQMNFSGHLGFREGLKKINGNFQEGFKKQAQICAYLVAKVNALVIKILYEILYCIL